MKLTDSEEINRFETALEGYFNLQIDAERFTSIRLQQGVYGQRQEGVNMLRVKIPGGSVNPEQLEAIAEVLDVHSKSDVAHVTTRQDIQIHSVPLAETPAAMRILAGADLTTREACGNTVRNITACPMAGVCPAEHVDVSTHLEGAVLHFLRNPLSQQMPRKFKISFSGCEADCAQSMIHDLGVVALNDGERYGFRVTAGGGLGHKPREAIVVEEFIEEKDLLIVMEALVSLHNRHSDRSKRAKSRIKFLVDRFGKEGFIEKYREELQLTKSALEKQPYPEGEWRKGAGKPCGQGAPRGIAEQKQKGLYVLPVALPLGNLDSNQLRGISAIAKKHGLLDIRTAQDQNLMILNVPEALVALLKKELAEIGLGLPKAGDDVTACPGTSTCRLGITSSMIAAEKIDGGRHDLRIRISGCHNGCAQPETGDIGIYGEGRRIYGRLIPHYQLYLGGNGTGEGSLAVKGPSIPAARITEAVERLKNAHEDQHESFSTWVRKQDKDYFDALFADLLEVKPDEIFSVLHDHGESREFKVLQLGGGECAGASQVKIGSTFFEAAHERRYRDALFMQRKYGEAAKCAESILSLIGGGLVALHGGTSGNEFEEISAHLKVLIPGRLSDFFEDIAHRLRNVETDSLSSLFSSIDAWTQDAAEHCLQQDSQLDLRDALPRAA
ncbi:MAG TPA: nitrite/sulfite reductase [Burkholderiales bacterium]|nr:nitrite/sulfite reductase [Burkholderiales bacterium]